MLPEDSTIVEALQSGNEKMFEQMFRHYYESLCNYANSILNDTDESEDIVQQIMIAIWEKRSTLKINVSLKSYLYRSVHNAALNKIRSRKVAVDYADHELAVSSQSAASTSDILAGKELGVRVQHAINQLPEQCRMVFKLSRFEGMKYSEIAAQLDISSKTVENHMGKALKILRLQLREFLVSVIIFIIFNFNL